MNIVRDFLYGFWWLSWRISVAVLGIFAIYTMALGIIQFVPNTKEVPVWMLHFGYVSDVVAFVCLSYVIGREKRNK